jgi:hypothetical protein
MIIAAPRIINTAEQTGEQLDILFPFSMPLTISVPWRHHLINLNVKKGISWATS